MINTIMAAITSFVVAAVIAMPIIKGLIKLKFGQKILEDGPIWHAKKQNTPTMGGIIFIIAVFVGVLAQLTQMIKTQDFKPLLMLALSTVFALVGFIDDWTKIKKKQNKGLSAMQKLLFQIAAAALFITVMRVLGYLSPDLYIPFVGVTISMPWYVYLVLCVFIIVGADNAVNLTDGIDGLCTSVTAIVALFFSIMLTVRGDLGAGFSGALFGGLAGFFLFNKNPAKVFMGDTGSLFLGGAVCAMAFALNMPLILVTVGIIYIIETLSDIIQVLYFKATGGKRFFKMAPIHHHFEKCGWSEWKIVIVFSAVTALMCLLSVFA
ncbi:MAG: phospho-N-acetylmuramoyl-pentapeptide-transferase [Clostridia bacterium]|nr:phospho-N-acetylmuramoyl-pentapeptide-transferase [Clostridia bacterium]